MTASFGSIGRCRLRLRCRRCQEARGGAGRRDPPAQSDSALVRPLARVLLGAGADAALEAELLAAARAPERGEALTGFRCGSALAVGFGDDFFAHGLDALLKARIVASRAMHQPGLDGAHTARPDDHRA